jgi:hypothetical protein
MERPGGMESQVFPQEMKGVREAPTDLAQRAEHPEDAVFPYLQREYLRCQLAVSGRKKCGDYRVMGCSACHIPYSNEGLYEGSDETVAQNEAGHA